MAAIEARVQMALPETRRKIIPGARVRTSLCGHGLGKGHLHPHLDGFVSAPAARFCAKEVGG
jgi:hypothetical protein